MTGMPQWNFPAFFKAEKELAASGWDVCNLAKLDCDQNDWLACMRVDIKQLVDCDAVYMLDGWRASRGGRCEYNLAHDLGLQIYMEEDGERNYAAGDDGEINSTG